MRVLVVGGGGREHTLAWSCARDRDDVELVLAPGNAGTATLGDNVALDVRDAASVARLARERDVDLVIIGPDAAAASGVADACMASGVAVFGPTAAAARIESSKTFAKQLMDEARIPTARWVSGDRDERAKLDGFIADLGGACVVKADGLALGKGVFVCDSADEARDALDACLTEQRFGDAGSRAVVEERLSGSEVSVLAITDGAGIRLLPLSRDYKRALDGDRGANTGGMGAIAPPPGVDAAELGADVTRAVLQPCVDAMRDRGTPFRGCLYAGLMLTADGPRVLEFNARFGDPEAQVILPLLDEPALELFMDAARGNVATGAARLRPGHAAGVVLAAAGYPGTPRTGDAIAGLEALDASLLCFHAGTRRDADGSLRTAGGRVLTLVSVAEDLQSATRHVYENMQRMHFDGMQYRRDIGVAAQPRVLSGTPA